MPLLKMRYVSFLVLALIIFTPLVAFGSNVEQKDNVRGEDCDQEVPAKMVQVTKSSSPAGEVKPDNDITYTIVVKNVTLKKLKDVKVLDEWKFSGEVIANYVNGSANYGAKVNPQSRQIMWTIPEIKAGESKVMSFKLHTVLTAVEKTTHTISNRVCVMPEMIYLHGDNKVCAYTTNTVTYKKVYPVKPQEPVKEEVVVNGIGGAGEEIVEEKPVEETVVLPRTGYNQNNYLYGLILFALFGSAFLMRSKFKK